MNKADKFWMCIAGIVLVALGVLCIVYPMATLLSLSWLIAILFFVGGCCELRYWSVARNVIPHSGLVFFSGLLQIVLGVMMIWSPAPTMIALPFIFAFWLLFEGINLSMISVDLKKVGLPKWWILLMIGLITAAFGVCCLVYPNVGAETISIIVGIGFILDGIGYWVRVALVNKVQNRFAQLQERFRAAFEEVAAMPEEPGK